MSGRDQEKKKTEVPLAKETKGKYAVAEIPTQTDLIIINVNDDKETYNVLTAVCKIMNDMEELKKK